MESIWPDIAKVIQKYYSGWGSLDDKNFNGVHHVYSVDGGSPTALAVELEKKFDIRHREKS